VLYKFTFYFALLTLLAASRKSTDFPHKHTNEQTSAATS